ncbi:hypothetical protein [Carboxylicivirga sp. RSCT41]|uniref:hypothetical protein n=1 Tax=Carboxylicivirga agarovorans TaxID=3417570 RepID=UPI003D34A3D3
MKPKQIKFFFHQCKINIQEVSFSARKVGEKLKGLQKQKTPFLTGDERNLPECIYHHRFTKIIFATFIDWLKFIRLNEPDKDGNS